MLLFEQMDVDPVVFYFTSITFSGILHVNHTINVYNVIANYNVNRVPVLVNFLQTVCCDL